MVKLDELYDDHDVESFAALRDDIARNGVRVPIVVDERGNIIDGFTRRRIADELSIDCPSVIATGITSDAQRVEIAVIANARHRRVRREQRDDAIAALRSIGWSNPRIAAALDVSTETVRLSTCENLHVDQTVGQDGRSRPSKRATKTEIERRRDVTAALAADGYVRDAISDALGVSHGTVASDLAARGAEGRGFRHGPIATERTYWRDDEPEPELPKSKPIKRLPVAPPSDERVPRYKTSKLFELLERFHAAFADEDYASQLAHLIDDADADGSDGRKWLRRQRSLMRHVVDETSRFQRILTDREYRVLCRDTEEGRERLRLRSVK